MTDYHIKIVDAFTRRPFAGNPCGVVTEATGLSDEQMQTIAREMNLSETTFVTASDVADFRVRFFTPRTEIPLAGHPTIATMHALAEEGRILLGKDGDGRKRVHQQLNVGVLPVDLMRDRGGSTRVVMTQATPEFGAQLDGGQVAKALGITIDDLLPGAPCQVVSTGTPQSMIPVRSIEVLKRLRPEPALLGQLEREGSFFSTHIFALDAFDPSHRVHSRHFAPSAGIIEDPVTGSASGGMAAYLWKYGLIREAAYSVEQGHIMGRPGVVELEVDADGDNPTTVRIAGTAVTVLRGVIAV